MSPADAHAQIMALLSRGQQSTAENLLAELLIRYPTDQPLLFLDAVCIRSRFEIATAFPLFARVVLLDPTTHEALAAQLIMAIDMRKDAQQRFKDLLALSQKYP